MLLGIISLPLPGPGLERARFRSLSLLKNSRHA
jgi:hypothetical protein